LRYGTATANGRKRDACVTNGKRPLRKFSERYRFSGVLRHWWMASRMLC
jgi:hypothetical protein